MSESDDEMSMLLAQKMGTKIKKQQQLLDKSLSDLEEWYLSEAKKLIDSYLVRNKQEIIKFDHDCELISKRLQEDTLAQVNLNIEQKIVDVRGSLQEMAERLKSL